MSDTIYKKLRNDLKMSRDEVCDYISDNELGYLAPERLERISITVEALQLWTEQMVANEKINMEKYKELTEN